MGKIFRFTIALCIFALAALVFPGRAAAQSDYTVIDVQNGGAIAGVVKWSGPIPKIPKLPITKNPEICDPESLKTRDLERLLINPDGNGVANTVVYLRGITKGKAFDLPEAREQLNQKTCRYVPHIMIVPQGKPLQNREQRSRAAHGADVWRVYQQYSVSLPEPVHPGDDEP